MVIIINLNNVLYIIIIQALYTIHVTRSGNDRQQASVYIWIYRAPKLWRKMIFFFHKRRCFIYIRQDFFIFIFIFLFVVAARTFQTTIVVVVVVARPCWIQPSEILFWWGERSWVCITFTRALPSSQPASARKDGGEVLDHHALLI